MLVALFAATLVHAQNTIPGVGGYGIKAGFGLATISTTVSEFEDYDSYAGGTLGVFVTYDFTPTVSLQTELLFVAKGAGGEFLRGRSWRHNYIEVPMLLKYCLVSERTFKPSLLFGPALSLLTSAEFKSSIISEDRDTKDAAGSVDVGIAFGGMVEYKHLALDVRYTVGMLNVYDPDKWNDVVDAQDPMDIYHMADDDYIKNRVLSFTLGYRF